MCVFYWELNNQIGLEASDWHCKFVHDKSVSQILGQLNMEKRHYQVQTSNNIAERATAQTAEIAVDLE